MRGKRGGGGPATGARAPKKTRMNIQVDRMVTFVTVADRARGIFR